MNRILIILFVVPIVLLAYVTVGYLALLVLATRFRKQLPSVRAADSSPNSWPKVSISLPVHNEADIIETTLAHLLAIDYPRDKLQILVISDASSDETNEIVRSYRERGIELLELTSRRGKTGAENAGVAHLRGEIIVNTDATTCIPPGSVKSLVAAFSDQTIGMASGRDMAIGQSGALVTVGESSYTNLEILIRRFETQLGSIVGASGCFYAVRRGLQQATFPNALSRDFAAAMLSREAGLRAVSVEEAICFVPTSASLTTEFRRKVRTMELGLATLWHYRALLNPLRYGSFAWMLFSHKLCRWLFFLLAPLLPIGALWATSGRIQLFVFATIVAGVVVSLSGILWPRSLRRPHLWTLVGFAGVVTAAALVAWKRFLVGPRDHIWEPTRRAPVV